VTLKCIYVRNPLSFNLSPKNLLIKGNLTFAAPIPLILYLSIILFSVNWSTISYSCLTVIGCYKLVSTILVSPPDLKVVAAVNGVMVAAFSGILFNLLNRNYGSNCITEPCSKYYGRLINGLGV